VVVPLRDGPASAVALIDEFVSRYGNRNTRRQYVTELGDLFARSRRDHPRLLTEADVLAWAGQHHLANNTKRNRLSRVCTFLRWCVCKGEADFALIAALTSRDNPSRRTPRLYGKVQAKSPARWLNYDEAFGRLLASCQDNTAPGIRDALVLRLGLAGLRTAEIIRLRLGDLHLDDHPPTIAWIGKASRSRRIVPGAQLLDLLRRYLASYVDNLRRALQPSDPLVCREKPGAGRRHFPGAIASRRRAASAVSCSYAPLRPAWAISARTTYVRTAAGILHHAVDEHGAHHFDLLDIQKVLDHADPATTMRSYLDPMDTTVKERAANYLD
jgi:integrase